MTFRTSIALTMIGTFILAAAFLLWRQGAFVQEQKPLLQEVRAEASREAPNAQAPVYRPAETVPQSTSIDSGPKAAKVYEVSSEQESPDLSKVPVPAMVLTVPDPHQPGDRNALLMSSSPETLNVSVTASNPASGTQSSVQTTISRGQTVHLSDFGLVVQPGDRITVHSPPYADREISAH
jgi:hypothetical protein